MSRRSDGGDAIRVHSEQAALFSERYEALAEDPYASSFAYSRHRLQVLLERMVPATAAGVRFLDVGCGTGHHVAWARSLGFEATGVDGSDDMLAEARRINPGARIERSSVERLPFETGAFDAVLCIEVLRYLPNTQPCIDELARVLRPGGTCLATASPLLNLNGFPLLNRAGLLVGSLGLVRLKQFFHTTIGLKRRFRRAGFSSVVVHGVYLGMSNWIEKAMPRSLAGYLRWAEPYDAVIADLPGMRDLSGMLLVHAVR